MFYDQYGDYDKSFMEKMANHIILRPRSDVEQLDDKDFAIIIIGKRPHRQFPIADKKSTLLSLIYFLKNLSRMAPEFSKVAGSRIKEACFRFGIDTPPILNQFDMGADNFRVKLEKVANEEAVKQITDTSHLDDSVFGLITEEDGQKIRRFPMPDEKHVHKAWNILQASPHIKEEYKSQLLENIRRRAKDLGVELDGLDEGELNPNFERDLNHFTRNFDEEEKVAYTKVASKVLNNEVTIKEASAIISKLNQHYGYSDYKNRLSPDEIVHGIKADSITKYASAKEFSKYLDPYFEKTASVEYNLAAILQGEQAETVKKELTEYFGPEMVEDLITDPQTIYSSLPAPHKDIIKNIIEEHLS